MPILSQVQFYAKWYLKNGSGTTDRQPNPKLPTPRKVVAPAASSGCHGSFQSLLRKRGIRRLSPKKALPPPGSAHICTGYFASANMKSHVGLPGPRKDLGSCIGGLCQSHPPPSTTFPMPSPMSWNLHHWPTILPGSSSDTVTSTQCGGPVLAVLTLWVLQMCFTACLWHPAPALKAPRLSNAF